jgi:hypothetical protein
MAFDDTAVRQEPATVTQRAAAMSALGLYGGANTPAEHTAEASRLGGQDTYRVRLANALLGAVQAEAVLADAITIGPEARAAACEQQLITAGAVPWSCDTLRGGNSMRAEPSVLLPDPPRRSPNE